MLWNQVLNWRNIFNAENSLATKCKPAAESLKQTNLCSSNWSPTLLLPPFLIPHSSWDLDQLTPPNPGGLYQIAYDNLSGTSNHISDFPSYNISNYIIRLGWFFFPIWQNYLCILINFLSWDLNEAEYQWDVMGWKTVSDVKDVHLLEETCHSALLEKLSLQWAKVSLSFFFFHFCPCGTTVKLYLQFIWRMIK